MSDDLSREHIEEARRIATEVFENLIRPHELETHDGEPCLANRAGTIAYFAHVIGIKVFHLPMLAEMLIEYEDAHVDHPMNGNGFPHE